MSSWIDVGSVSDWIMVAVTVGLVYYAYATISEGKKDRRKAAIARQLEGLYNPLYVLVKYFESISSSKKPGLTYLAYGMDSEEANRGQRQLDEIILKGSYLADDKGLEELLPRIVHAGFYQETNKEAGEKIVQLIISGYERLRNEYLSLWCQRTSISFLHSKMISPSTLLISVNIAST